MPARRTRLVRWLTAVAVAALITVAASGAPQAQRAGQAFELQTNIADGFTLTAVGDLISAYPHAVNADADFQAAIEIIRRGDVAFGNFEVAALDFRRFRTQPARFAGPPEIAADFEALGFDMVGRANNHLLDFGVDGMLATNRAIDDAGLVYAGSGQTHGAARAPHYLSTPKGRVALVAMSSSFRNTTRSLPSRGEAPERAGLSTLGTMRHFTADSELMKSVRAIRGAFPTGGSLYAPQDEPPDRIQILGEWFKRDSGKTPRYSYDMNEADLEEILTSVRAGKQRADFMMVALHAHQTTGTVDVHRDASIPDFLPVLAKTAIDNGADAFLGSGVHVLRGIEIYKGRPIFYGFGEFFRQMDAPLGPYTGDDRVPERPLRNSLAIKYESIIAESRFAGGQLAEVRLYPLDRGHEKQFANRGVPHRASPEVGRRILERLQRLSKPLGTTIAIEGGRCHTGDLMTKTTRVAALSLVAALAVGCGGSEPEPPVSEAEMSDTDALGSEMGSVLRLDPRVDALVPTDAQIEKLAEGFVFIEGPVWLRGESRLLFSDVRGNTIYQWTEADGASPFIDPVFEGDREGLRSISSNGLTLDADGRLIICEHGNRRISRVDADGTRTVLVDRYEGQRLNSPNDATYGSDGSLYFTDPPYGLDGLEDSPLREVDFNGVYRLRPNGDLELLVRDQTRPNGIALSPDESTLYVANSDAENRVWMAYDLDESGASNARVFYDLNDEEADGAADGMEVDRAGHLFATGPGGVWIIAPDGSHLGTIMMPEVTANVAWGDDGRTLYMTGSTSLYRIALSTEGVIPGP